MKLNKKLTIALVAITTLRKSEKSMNATQLALVTNSTVDFLSQILLGLTRAGIIKSVKGPGGGYYIGEGIFNAYAVSAAVGCTLPVPTKEAGLVRSIETSIVNTFLNTAV